MGLLLLRAAVGATAIAEGYMYVAGGGNPTPAGWVGGLTAAASGAALLIGFVTPVASILGCLGVAAIALSWLPAPTANLFDTRLSIILFLTMSAVIVLVGPGAFSLDARLFGRREIIIPQAGLSKS